VHRAPLTPALGFILLRRFKLYLKINIARPNTSARAGIEDGNDSVLYRAVEPDSLTADFWHISHVANCFFMSLII